MTVKQLPSFDRYLDNEIDNHFRMESFATPIRYCVKHRRDEFLCHFCGAPVDVGDMAVSVECLDRCGEFLFCSLECNERDLIRWWEI